MSTTTKRENIVINLVEPIEVILYGIKVKTTLIDLRAKEDVQLYEGTNNTGRTIRTLDKSGFVCEVLRQYVLDIKEGDKDIWDHKNKWLLEN